MSMATGKGTAARLGADWVTGLEAARILGISKSRFGVINRQLPDVRVWSLPGSRRWYNRADLERLAASAISVPADANAE